MGSEETRLYHAAEGKLRIRLADLLHAETGNSIMKDVRKLCELHLAMKRKIDGK